jgi:hypothetical protein
MGEGTGEEGWMMVGAEDSPKGRKIWAVTSGQYSDYEVNILFESKEDAEAYLAEGFGDSVEKFTIMPLGYRPTITIVYRASYWHEMSSTSYPKRLQIYAEKHVDDDGSVAAKYQELERIHYNYHPGHLIRMLHVDATVVEAAIRERLKAFGINDAGAAELVEDKW